MTDPKDVTERESYIIAQALYEFIRLEQSRPREMRRWSDEDEAIAILHARFDNELAMLVNVTLYYDFSTMGFNGLKFLVGWGQGIDAINPTTEASESDRNLLNLHLDYEPSGGRLEGLRVQLYYSNERLLNTACLGMTRASSAQW